MELTMKNLIESFLSDKVVDFVLMIKCFIYLLLKGDIR